MGRMLDTIEFGLGLAPFELTALFFSPLELFRDFAATLSIKHVSHISSLVAPSSPSPSAVVRFSSPTYVCLHVLFNVGKWEKGLQS